MTAATIFGLGYFGLRFVYEQKKLYGTLRNNLGKVLTVTMVCTLIEVLLSAANITTSLLYEEYSRWHFKYILFAILSALGNKHYYMFDKLLQKWLTMSY